MPIEMGLWRIDGEKPQRIVTSALPTEAMLEDFLEKDPSLLGAPLLVIGRQVRTPYNKYIDLLAVDADGAVHVLELKRDKTPREVVAQILDYGSWAGTLTRDDLIDIAHKHLGAPFEAAFADTFDTPPPDELNAELQLTIVATKLDDSSERIVTYLRTFGVPINAVFFAHLEDNDRRYLARSWLAEPGEGTSRPGTIKKGKRADWNGRDWFVSFGEYEGGRQWVDGRRFGFVSAGGGGWYSRSLRSVPTGARVNVYIPKAGYVAVGETLGPAHRFDEANVRVNGDWTPLRDLPLSGRYRHGSSPETDSDEDAEYAIPVEWIASSPREEAFWEKGMFANQNSAGKLRQEFTLNKLSEHFALGDEE